MTYVVIPLLIIWFGISVLWQLQIKPLSKFRGYDVFGLIPNWSFFAPNPGTSDYHVVYRDKHVAGTFTEWQELSLLSARGAVDWLWHPRKRRTKLVCDCVNAIARMIRQHRTADPEPDHYDGLCLTVPYLLLLNAVTNSRPPSGAVTHRYFAVVETYGYPGSKETRPLVRSALHPIKRSA
jgi:hypothetical protein